MFEPNLLQEKMTDNFVMCRGGTRDEMTGSSSDDWIY
jgi:hypothetical protein